MTADNDLRIAEIAAAIGALPEPMLCATDVDGTLSPLVDEPEEARLYPGALDELWFIALSGRRIAVISGRPLDDLIGQFNFSEEFTLIGSLGAEFRKKVELSPDERARLAEVKRIFGTILDSAPGSHIEHKTVAASFHVRRVDPSLGDVALARARQLLAPVPGITIHEGHCVVEAAVRPSHKAAAMAALLEQEQPASVVFIGDDAADERVFAALAASDLPFVSVKVGEGETLATCRLANPASVVALLHAVAST